MQKTAYELRISDWSSDVCSSDLDYAGDVSVDEAWHVLGSDGKAVLVDVRTRPEWQFVGIPDLSGMGKQVAAVSWQAYPDMDRNPQFEDAVRARSEEHTSELQSLMRSSYAASCLHTHIISTTTHFF